MSISLLKFTKTTTCCCEVLSLPRSVCSLATPRSSVCLSERLLLLSMTFGGKSINHSRSAAGRRRHRHAAEAYLRRLIRRRNDRARRPLVVGCMVLVVRLAARHKSREKGGDSGRWRLENKRTYSEEATNYKICIVIAFI